MSYVRSDGYRLKDPDDDAALQVVIGDLKRLALAMYKGTENAAYALTPEAAAATGATPTFPISVANGGTAGASIMDALFNLYALPIGGNGVVSTLITAGSGTHTFTPGKKFCYFLAVGGGGGGGSSSGGTASDFGGGGGGHGAVRFGCLRITSASVDYAIGAGGAGASATPTAGSTGGTTSITGAASATGGGGGDGGTLAGYSARGGTGYLGALYVTEGLLYWGFPTPPGSDGRGFGRGGFGGQTGAGQYGTGGNGASVSGNTGSPGAGGFIQLYET